MSSLLKMGLVACALLDTGLPAFAVNRSEQGQKPNILFILSDDHTSQSWGIYGGILGEYAKMKI